MWPANRYSNCEYTSAILTLAGVVIRGVRVEIRRSALRCRLVAVADQCIAQTVLEWAEPGLIVPPLEEPLAENRLADLL